VEDSLGKDLVGRLNQLKDIKQTLEKLHVNKDLNLDKLTEDELNILRCLVDGILFEQPVPLRYFAGKFQGSGDCIQTIKCEEKSMFIRYPIYHLWKRD